MVIFDLLVPWDQKLEPNAGSLPRISVLRHGKVPLSYLLLQSEQKKSKN
jgi:hypothetical protein